MKDDFVLLQRFVRDGSAEAFETLTSRYLNLIYSAAMRVTGDAHLAEDVTQAVLVVLARKAPELRESTVLPAWLLTTTRLTALRAIRNVETRRRLERAAAMIKQGQRDNEGLPPWAEVAPLLDEAMAGLSAEDRAALAVRYFQSGCNADVARELNISPVAAEKRVMRAVDKLRQFFKKKGMGISCVGLAALLGAHSVQAAPAAFAATAAAQALAAHASGAGASAALAEGVIRGMSAAAYKIPLAAASVLLALGVAGLVVYNAWRASAAPLAANVVTVPQALAAPRTINLLPMIDLKTCVVNGEWKLDKGELLTDKTAYAKVQIPYQPPAEYDFKISFTVLEPYADVTQICSKNDRQFCWKMGVDNKFCAFEQIGGVGHDNDTQRVRPNLFRAGERHESVVRVRNDGVTSLLDGVEVSSFKTNFNDVSLFAFYRLYDNRILGLGSWCTVVRFHSVELLELTGSGTPREPSTVNQRPTPPSEDVWKDEMDLMPLIDAKRDAVAGNWRMDKGTLFSDGTAAARLEIPYRPPEEYLYKIEFSRNTGIDAVSQILGHKKQNFQWNMAIGNEFMSFEALNPFHRRWNPTTHLEPFCFMNWVRHTSVVHVRKDGFSSFVDGKLISHWINGYAIPKMPKEWDLTGAGLLGVGSDSSATAFYSIKVVELSGKGRVETPVKARRELLKEMPPLEVPAKTPTLENAAF